MKPNPTNTAQWPALNRVSTVYLCGDCLDGTGGECHTPGCVLWMKSAPDVPIRDLIEACGGKIEVCIEAEKER